MASPLALEVAADENQQELAVLAWSFADAILLWCGEALQDSSCGDGLESLG